MRNNEKMVQKQYLSQWHDSLVAFIEGLLVVIAKLSNREDATEEEKRVLVAIKGMLTGKDTLDVEHDLASGVVKRSTLDKIVKINKDMTDMCLEHVQMNPLVREFWKQMTRIRIEQSKLEEEMRLNALRIPVLDG